MLAVETVRRQGVDVLALAFHTPFFGFEKAKESAEQLKVPFRAVDITEEHLEIVRNPRFGLGRFMNPCMDCHALMFKKAGEILDEEGYDFLFSGEVLGQRPFSQNKRALSMVADASGRADIIVRPLSAKHLPASGPEKFGLIDRGGLLDFRGRSRKPQMATAREWEITTYPTPAGGCLLTDPTFSRRLSDLFENEQRWEIRDLKLLGSGRHLRIYPDRKIVVGRNKDENAWIKSLSGPEDILLDAQEFTGPTVIVPYGGPEDLVEISARVCLRYGDAPKDAVQKVCALKGDSRWTVEATAQPPEDTDRWLI